MDRLIPVINRLQDALGTIHTKVNLELPQIVVVGAQSSGKSSVLESIVGKDFLPRGSGIVTRRPLVLHLTQTHSNEEWGEFTHMPGKKFKDFDKIRHEIEAETERLLGKKANISNESIFLRIYSPNVLDVTLVDLPGLTKVPVGDQPIDIEAQIRRMILDFITNPNSIILAISNANQDLANSDSLKLAREVDPTGDRTLGVITKIDLMDKGTDAMEMLKGKLYPLKLGYVGVMCRSQADINANKLIKKHLEDEKKFFTTHEKYRAIAHSMGIPHLSWKLNRLLMHHIKAVLPDLKKKVSDMIRSNEEQLRTYGFPLSENRDLQGVVMLNVITSYATSFSNAVEGKTLTEAGTELEGGAKIRDILLRKFIQQLKNMDALNSMDDSDIKNIIDSSCGVMSSLLIPEAAFHMLLKMQIKRLLDPSQTVAMEVYDQLKILSSDIVIPEAVRFPNLQPSILSVVDNVLEDCLKPAQDFITDFIDIQQAYVNSFHPDCINVREALHRAEKDVEEMEPSMHNSTLLLDKSKEFDSWGKSDNRFETSEDEKNELIQIYTIRHLLTSYFDVIKKNVGDYVSKAVMSFLVIKVRDKIQTDLISKLYNNEKFNELFAENADIPFKRKALEDQMEGLNIASKILSEVRDFDLEHN